MQSKRWPGDQGRRFAFPNILTHFLTFHSLIALVLLAFFFISQQCVTLPGSTTKLFNHFLLHSVMKGNRHVSARLEKLVKQGLEASFGYTIEPFEG